MTKAEAQNQLVEAGCENKIAEDREGNTQKGWWLDDVFLANDDRDALYHLLA